MNSRWRRSGKNQVILVNRLAGIHASGNERPGPNGQNWRHAIESAWFNFREGALFVSVCASLFTGTISLFERGFECVA